MRPSALLLLVLLAGCLAPPDAAADGFFVVEATGSVTGDGAWIPTNFSLHADPAPRYFEVDVANRTLRTRLVDAHEDVRLVVLDRVEFNDPLDAFRCCASGDTAWTSKNGSMVWMRWFRGVELNVTLDARAPGALLVDGAPLAEGESTTRTVAFTSGGRNYTGEITLTSRGEWPASAMTSKGWDEHNANAYRRRVD